MNLDIIDMNNKIVVCEHVISETNRVFLLTEVLIRMSTRKDKLRVKTDICKNECKCSSPLSKRIKAEAKNRNIVLFIGNTLVKGGFSTYIIVNRKELLYYNSYLFHLGDKDIAGLLSGKNILHVELSSVKKPQKGASPE